MIRINFIGDIMLGELLENYKRGVKSKIKNISLNPFEYCKDILNSSTLNIGNLECPISDISHYGPFFSKILRAPSNYIKILKNNNINIVNMANNHALDHGKEAFENTIVNLEENRIKHIGYSPGLNFQYEPLIIEKEGINISFLGYNIANFNTQHIDSEIIKIKRAIRNAKKKSDILILSIHWGYEYINLPTPKFIKIGKNLIESGVDILYGHHSHQLQGVIKYKNKIFAPSLGNFIFDDMRDEQRRTAILEVQIDKDKNINFNLMPYYINENYQPEPQPNMKNYLNKINDNLKELFFLEDHNFLIKIENQLYEKSKRGHWENRIRLRKMLLKNIKLYFPHLFEILYKKIIIKEKMFSIIGD